MNFHSMVDIYSKFLLRGRLSRAVTCALTCRESVERCIRFSGRMGHTEGIPSLKRLFYICIIEFDIKQI